MSAPDCTLLLGGPSEALTDVAAQDVGVEVAATLEEGLARLTGGEPPVVLVVIDPSWPQPLAAARSVRQHDGRVALAVATSTLQLSTVRSRLAFLPDVEGVDVVAADLGPGELRRALEETATSSRQRQRVRGALDAINRGLQRPAARTEAARSGSVSEHYLAALVRHAADTIVSFDPQGRVVTINGAGQRTLGLDPVGAEGRALEDLLADDDAGGLPTLLRAAAGGRPQVDDEVEVRLRHGQRLLLSATAAPVLDDVGSLAGLVLIARDVTSERQAEERLRALQKAESLATLASGVAHDFNNLLAQAQGWADLAREDPTDTALVEQALERIGLVTRRAGELARAMLAYGGRGHFEPQRLRLADLVTDLEPLLAASLPPDVRLEVHPTTDVEVHADPTQLRQVVLNLVGNATEAIGDEEGSVHVRTGTVTLPGDDAPPDAAPLPAGEYAVVEVSDDGPGIEPELRDRLFDPFFTTKFTGRGLGLAASEGIVRAHGGRITVDSRPGHGARFRVHLPVT